MSTLSLNDYYGSKDKYALEEDEIFKVHKEIARLRATYPTELARNLFMDQEKVHKIIDYLLTEAVILRLKLDPAYVDNRLFYRIGHFWRRGILGFFMFSRFRWVVINPKLYWGSKEKYLLEHPKVEEVK